VLDQIANTKNGAHFGQFLIKVADELYKKMTKSAVGHNSTIPNQESMSF